MAVYTVSGLDREISLFSSLDTFSWHEAKPIVDSIISDSVVFMCIVCCDLISRLKKNQSFSQKRKPKRAFGQLDSEDNLDRSFLF